MEERGREEGECDSGFIIDPLIMYKHPLSLFFAPLILKLGAECTMPSFSATPLPHGTQGGERNGCEWSNDRENDRGEIEISIL